MGPRPWLAAGLACLVMAACGRPPGPAGGSEGGPATPAPVAPAVSLSEADTGRRVDVHVGEVIQLALHTAPGFTDWSPVRTSDGAVLGAAGGPPGGAGLTAASFRALAPGTARLEAACTLACSPGMACAALARVWSVTVTAT